MNNGNVNNNNKNNTYRVRAVAPVPGAAGLPSLAITSVVYDIPFSSVIEAWISCERNKKTSPSCIKFRWHAARDLANLWEQMRTATYVPYASMCFMVTYPVLREVWAGAFRDRVAHHWEADRFQPVIEKWIKESGDMSMNCRKGYGGLMAVTTMYDMIRHFTENYTRQDCYIVGGDFANYFMSIDKPHMWMLLEQLIMDEYEGDDKAALLYMMHCTLFHRCQDNYYRRSPECMWDALPPRKSLFFMDGLPIGNLPSQLWANFKGAQFMYWMMFIKKHPEFLLFVDDWRTLVHSLEEGRQLIAEVKQYLKDELLITLHPDKIYLQHYTKGTKMVGAVLKPGRIYIANRTRGKFIQRVMEFNAKAASTDEQGRLALLEPLRASVNSYLGMMVHYQSYKVRRRICMELVIPTWGKYVYFQDRFAKLIIKRKYNPLYNLRRKLKKHKFAAKFIRPVYQE